MAKQKDKVRPPSIEAEVPLKKGALVWIATNPPLPTAHLCGCPRSDCSEFLWVGSIAVRNMRGVYLSVACAIQNNTTNWGEVDMVFPGLLQLKGIRTREEKAQAERAEKAERVRIEAARKKDREIEKLAKEKAEAEAAKAKTPKTKTPKTKTPKTKTPKTKTLKTKTLKTKTPEEPKPPPRKRGRPKKETPPVKDLAEDAFANAPAHVRAKLLKKRRR